MHVSGGEIREQRDANKWTVIRRLCLVTYLVGTICFMAIRGVPTSHLSLMSIVVLGLATSCIGNGWRRLARVIIDWIPFTLVLLVYDRSRNVAVAVNMPIHDRDIAHLETWLFGGTTPTVFLQNHFYTPSAVHWYDAVATLVYTSHFLATPVLAAILWLRHRDVWLSYISRVIALSFAGLITYVLFPEAPPWLASRHGYIDPVSRLSARGWIWLHVGNLQKLLSDAQNGGANPFAAMPSLHAGFAMLIALFVASRLVSRWRYLVYLYPATMGLVLVYTGEHYVLDVLAGALYALAAHRVIGRWERDRVPQAALSELTAESMV